MKTFPQNFSPKNKEIFNKILLRRLKCYLRRDIFDHIISHEETDYFSLDKFNFERVQNMETTKEIAKEIIIELEELGWKCKTSFGGTGLFIYSTEKPPINYHEEIEN